VLLSCSSSRSVYRYVYQAYVRTAILLPVRAVGSFFTELVCNNIYSCFWFETKMFAQVVIQFIFHKKNIAKYCSNKL